MSATWLIWDTEGKPPEGKWIPVLWKSYGNGGNLVYSIPRIVEEHADALRSRFLAWIYDLGESQVNGKRLVDHLEMRPGFSYWWMTLIAEKSNAYKSIQIVNALKLFALEELVVAHSMSTIILVSNDKVLMQTFRLWCKKAGLIFKWQPLQGQTELASLIRKLYRSMPQPIQAIIWLAHYIWQSLSFKQENARQNMDDATEMTFVDYLFNLDERALTMGCFASKFWTGLISVLDHSGRKVHWLHLYIQHKVVKSTKKACDLIVRFNQNRIGSQFHTCLNGALSISVVLAALIDYSRLVWLNLKLNKVKRLFCPAESKLDLWPLFRLDWRNSMFGWHAISNCLVLNLFERTLSRLPHQKLGVYLQENQDWERSFIHAWKAAGHGILVGVPHATIRHWDLRYFSDPRNYQRTGKNDMPLPDKVALNGLAAMAAYRKGAYPADQMIEVEALRYLYLADGPPKQMVANAPSSLSLSVLILGDYIYAATHMQMQWLVGAALILPPATRYIFKPHPFCPVKASDYPSLTLQVTDLPLSQLLSECDVAYTSNITSAAVDAYALGVPVVSMLEGGSLNMSPLRGLKGMIYVTNPNELASALQTARHCARVTAEPYFCLDKALPRWRNLLGLPSVPTGITKYVET